MLWGLYARMQSPSFLLFLLEGVFRSGHTLLHLGKRALGSFEFIARICCQPRANL